jgi:hypothetical protein
MNGSGLAPTLDALAAIMAMQNDAFGRRPKTILANQCARVAAPTLTD